MKFINKCAPLACALGWLGLLIAAILVKDVDFRKPFICAAAVNVAVFIAQFLVVKNNDR